MSPRLYRAVSAASLVLLSGTPSLAQDTRAQSIVNAPVLTGKTTVISLEAQLSAAGGRAGGGKVLDGSIEITNASAGKLTNAARHDGDATVIATGPVVMRSIQVTDGAKTQDLTNAPQRDGRLTVIAGGGEVQRGSLSALPGASTTGGATLDSIRVCGGRVGNVTNAGRVKGDATYIGGNVTANSVVMGCN